MTQAHINVDDTEACHRCGSTSWGQTPEGNPECTRCLFVELPSTDQPEERSGS